MTPAFTHRPFWRVAGLALAIAATQGALLPLPAQGRTAEDTRTVDGYRLTMPTLRKVLPALYAEGADTCERQKGRDPHTLSIAEMTPREAAIAFASLLRTGQQVAMRGGKATALPPGVLRDNALLLEQNDLEIRRLIKTAVPAS